MISSDAPTYISSPSPLIDTNRFDFLEQRYRSKSPLPLSLCPSPDLNKLDYSYSSAAASALPYTKKLRNRYGEVST